MKDENPYIVLTHHHDGRVLAVVVDGTQYTPMEIKEAIAALTERPSLLTERDGARAETDRLRSAALAFRAAYYGDPAHYSLTAAWAALEAALDGRGDA